MIGGGQLARMTHQAAIALGQTLRVLAVTPDDPAAQVTPDVVIGSHDNLEALRRAAAGADALTFDHEHVPTDLLEKLVADGVNVAPPPSALIHAQDKLVMRRRLEALGAPVPRFAEVSDIADVDAFATGSALTSWSRRRAAVMTAAASPWPVSWPRRVTSRAVIWPTAPRCFSRRRSRCAASWRRWWHGHRSARVRHGRWCRR